MLKCSFLGDISLNDKYIEYYKHKRRPFDNIKKKLYDSELVIGNLECLAEGHNGENELKNPILKTDLDTLNYLKDIRLNLATLAHNHIYDNLVDGFEKTTSFLKLNHIDFIGASKTLETLQNSFIIEKEGLSIGIVNYVTKDTNPSLPEICPIKLSVFEKEKVMRDIHEIEDECDFVVALLHWGGNYEHSLFPGYDQVKEAREMIDCGVDLIVGHHSHTLQPYEIYKGKYIFYSLGNFCFSNILSDGILHEIDWVRNAESIILEITFGSENYRVDLIPI